jgi:hypothetical protein
LYFFGTLLQPAIAAATTTANTATPNFLISMLHSSFKILMKLSGLKPGVSIRLLAESSEAENPLAA